MFGRYLLGVAEVALIVAAAGFGASGLRRALAAGWTGPPARLAEAVIGLSLVVVVMQVLGGLGLLHAVPLMATTIVVGALAGLWGRRRVAPAFGETAQAPPSPPPSATGVAVALVVGLLVAASWGVRVHFSLDHGMYGEDTTWYHLPHAATFAHDGSITGLTIGDPYLLFWLYPGNSELLHAGGMIAFGNDFPSVLLNMAWLGVALLAAWCIGRPYGVGPASLVAIAVLLQSKMFLAHPNPGGAKNDIVAVALLLAAVALLVNGRGRRGLLLIAGLAAGLAVGTKLNLLVPVGVLTLGVIAVGPRERWRARALVWLPALLATGGLWYIRNLIRVGNPLPMLDAGLLPTPRSFTGGFQPPFSIAHYLTDSPVWHRFFAPGLHTQLGVLWPAVLAAAVLTGGVILWRGRTGIEPVLGAVVCVTAVTYVFTPLTAFGLDGFPVGFEVNLRYLAPALALGLVLLPTLPGLDRGWPAWTVLGALLVLFGTERPFALLSQFDYPPAALALALLVVGLPVALGLLAARGTGRPILAAGIAAAVVLAAALGWPAEHAYLRDRYRDPPGIYAENPTIAWAQDVRDSRIAVIGSRGAFAQYPLYGHDLSNHVRYLGLRGAHGGFLPIEDCVTWRRALNAGRYDYLVAAPFLFLGRHTRAGPQVEPRLELGWTLAGTGARVLERGGGFTIVRLGARLDPAGCRKAPDRFEPQRVRVRISR